MSSREFFLERRAAEAPVFVRVLKALPADKLDYKPHERSPSAQQLVWTMVGELKSCLEVVADGRTEWKDVPIPPLDEMISLYERWSNELADAVSKMDDATWDRKAQLYFDGKMVFEQETGKFLWFILFDAIHHRGQISAYLRPMGGKVPSIYGPSADEQGGM